MIFKMKILGWRINFVFRHRYEKDLDLWERRKWNDYKLGVWFKINKLVGKPKDGPAIIGKKGTTTNSYMFGVELILCRFWIDISYRPLMLKI